MSPVIKELYGLATPPILSSEELEKRKELDRYYEKIERAFSPLFLEGLLDYDDAAYEVRVAESFQRGFRLGAGIMLEVLRD